MNKFSQILESSHDIKFVRNVIFDEDHHSYFDYSIGKSDAYDDSIKATNSDIWDILYFPIDAKIGDTIYLMIKYDENNDVIVQAFKNVYDAIHLALKEFIENAYVEKVSHYGVKVFKEKLTDDKAYNNIKSLQYFERKDHIMFGDKNDDNDGEVYISPEYANEPKIKNILLSMNGINKFKL